METKQLIQKLINIIKNYEKENKELKETVKEIQTELLPYKKQIEKIEKEKKEKLLKESTILSFEQKEIVSNWIYLIQKKNLLYYIN